MDGLRSLVLDLSNAERVGGRAQVVDARTLILYDCVHWSSRCTDILVARYPEVQISVRACRQSLSGYSIVFHRSGNTRAEIVWCLVIGLALAGCAYILLHPPWWSRSILHI
jgi:hypothetical protein